MTAVVFVQSPGYVPSTPSVTNWTSMRHTLVGLNGDTWDLCSGTSGVRLRAGARGMGTPEYDDKYDEGGFDGADWLGAFANKREVFWPLSVYQRTSSAEWVEHDRRVWRSLRRRNPVTWIITNPYTSESRSLQLRIADDGGFAPLTDPSLQGWAQYDVRLYAEQPYWTGKTITRRFDQPSPPVNFFGGGDPAQPGYGPPFVLSQGSSLATATISNDGDADAYPLWTAAGGQHGSTASFGLNNQQIVVPSVAAGEWVQVDTLNQTAIWGTAWLHPDGSPASATDYGAVPDYSQGVKRIPDGIGQVAFAPVPPGDFQQLQISLTGDGFVRMDLTPLYERAW